MVSFQRNRCSNSVTLKDDGTWCEKEGHILIAFHIDLTNAVIAVQVKYFFARHRTIL